MEEKRIQDAAGKNGLLVGWKRIAAVLILYDIVMSYFSYFVALLLRFELHFALILDTYWKPFLRFAPVFAAATVVVFIFFRLYNSMWKYVGFNELVRILGACAVTTLIQVLGTLIFVFRMPVSYYVIGAAGQLFFTMLSRFSYRIYLSLKTMYSMRGTEPGSVMVIGCGETARMIIKDLLSSPGKMQEPVCIVTEQSYSWDRSMYGIPVVGGKECIREAVEKYNIKTIIFADPSLPYCTKKEVMEICEATGRDIQNFSGFEQLDTKEISVKRLMGKLSGTVILSFNGIEREYPDPKEALSSLQEKYVIREISSKNGSVRLTLSQDIVTPSDLSRQWAEDYIKSTGELPSYF